MKSAVVFLALLAVAAANVAVTTTCDNVNQDACTINELRITPCSRRPCPLKIGRNASMEFDYTPNFSADKLTTAVYWAEDRSETPFPAVGVVDACPHTTCPAVAGTRSTLQYSLYIGKKLPKGVFDFRWKLWNDANKDQVCCFETKVKLQ